MKILLTILLFPVLAHSQKLLPSAKRLPIIPASLTYDTIPVRATNSGSTTAGWNNLIPATSLSLTNMTKLDGVTATTVDLALNAYTGSTSVTVGCTDPTLSGFPLSTTFRNVNLSGANMTLTISDIPAGKTVDVVFYENRPGITSTFTATSQSQTATIANIDANCTAVAKLVGLIPSSNSVSIVVGSNQTLRNLQAFYIILY